MNDPQHDCPSEPNTDIHWPRTDGALEVLGGEYDLSAAEQLNKTLAETLERCSQLIVDIRGTQFIDSTISVPPAAKGRADAADRQLNILLATTPPVERVLEISGMPPVLNRVHTLDEALFGDPPLWWTRSG